MLNVFKMKGALNKPTPDLQKELIERCRQGDRKAQLELYGAFYRSMYNISLRIVRDTAEAEDIMQDSFLKAFNKLSEFRGEVSFGAWLKRIVINQSIDHIRKRSRWHEESLDEVNDYEASVADEELSYDEALYKLVNEEIGNLPDGYRLVLSLHLLEGYDYGEISDIMGLSASTVRSQYVRGRKRLAENLKRKRNGQI
jgi:RNA polymerase sigma factor (sigma-70 family)